MPKPTRAPELEHRATADAPTSDIRRGALAAVCEVNEQLLDALCEAAGADREHFPLPHPVRPRLAQLSSSDRRRAAQCGLLLADAGFSDPRRLNQALSESPRNISTGPCASHWSSLEHAVALAHSTLFVTWHIVRTNPTVAGVLLGVPSQSAAAYAQIGVRDLAYIAQRNPHWIGPRWPDRLEIWTSLLDLATSSDDPNQVCLTLRCLQLSGGHAPWLAPFVAAA
jgi:hypothetical protein